ncbi:TonB-dependent receptor domain-containing protein [Paremcibacter congregatus]|uniref:Secretin/TonB short N-terminal domain-containing protein n=1 Tax=Paremcibacter congregatus TaxID=2043170 RepID=A0A2G4YR31_9PROT|nr:TonB-dependent receptor [Paremcibacter congregatus]PHZ84782.1 hypothetical protein CRD36_10145 [Paremcibacter congregatus]QDE26235.1 TonB-dependent receptor [Paremcibacter congregatus]
MFKTTLQKKKSFQGFLVRTVSIAALTCLLPVMAQAQDLSLHIKKQSLANAVTELSKQADIVIVAPSEILSGKKALALKGYMSVEEALDQLLKGTSLMYTQEDEGTFVVSRPLMQKISYNSSSDFEAELGVYEDDERADEVESVGFEEIVVTATKRAQNLQDVPISISAFTAADFKDAGANSFKDLANSIPNVILPDSFSPVESDISIRGIYSDVVASEIGFDVGYGVYLDGVFLGKQFGANADLGDIERLEVLRGPQGTLFGKNTISGAINIISKKPGNDLEGSVEVDAGNFDLFRVRGSINIPIIEDVLAVRMSVSKVRRDGYVKNITLNDDNVGSVDQVSGRIHFAYTPSDSTRAYLSLDGLDSHGTNYSLENIEENNNRPFVTTVNAESSYGLKNFGASLIVEHDFHNGYMVSSTTGLRKDKSSLRNDEDLSLIDGFSSDNKWQQRTFSQELRLISPVGSWYDFVAGLHYFNQNNDRDLITTLGQDWVGPALVGKVFTKNSVDVRSWAAYIHANVHLNDELTLFGGARYTKEKKKIPTFNQFTSPAFIIGVFGRPSGELAPFPEINDDAVTGTAGIRYEFSDDLMIYTSVSSGFKSGGYTSGFTLTPDNITNDLIVKPELVTSYEVGLKSSWLDRRLTMNLAMFYMDYRDLQVRTFDPTGGFNGSGAVLLRNAASVTSKGVELELIARPTDQLTFNASVGYLDSTFDNYTGVPVSVFGGAADANDGAIDGFTDASGNQVPLAPKWTANMAAQHEMPLGDDGTWITRLDYNYTASRFDSGGVTNEPEAFIPSFGLLNARMGYRSNDDRWGVYLWAKNLTDERKIQSSGFSSFIIAKQLVKYIEPRTYGVSLKYNF